MHFSIQLTIRYLYGNPFGYPWISMDIHAWAYYGFSIQDQVHIGIDAREIPLFLSWNSSLQDSEEQ